MKLIILIIFSILVYAKKKQFDPQSIKPANFDSYIYCNACQAIIKETLLIIRESRSEIDINDALSKICKTNFQGYAYLSKTIGLGCEVFLMGWQEMLEEQLQKRQSNDQFEQYFCTTFSQACKDINPLEVQQYRQEMHKRKQPVKIDGHFYMPDSEGYVDKSTDRVDL